MNPAFESFSHSLDQLQSDVKQLVLESDEAELVDAAAMLNSLASYANQTKRDIVSELPVNTIGHHWILKQSNRATRTYNAHTLLAKFTEKQGHLLGAIQWLIRVGALKLEWSWSKLERAAQQADVTLVIANHEIGEGDLDADIGVVWALASPRFEPRADV